MKVKEVCEFLKERLTLNETILETLQNLYKEDRDPRLKKAIDTIIYNIIRLKALINKLGCKEWSTER